MECPLTHRFERFWYHLTLPIHGSLSRSFGIKSPK